LLQALAVPAALGVGLSLGDARPTATPLVPAKPPSVSPRQAQALRKQAQALEAQRQAQAFRRLQPLLPRRDGPGDAIPRTYLVFGYGTDARGRGPFLDASGNALPIGGTPRVQDVWTFHDAAPRAPTAAQP
jgi:hypothetical protein